MTNLSPVRAGVLYFAAVFLAGVLLGAIRVPILEPKLGRLAAVLLELPVILAWSWFIAGRLLACMIAPIRRRDRAAMGGTGFILLMAAEFLFAALAENLSPGAWLGQYLDAPAQAGLLGQIGFALFPLIR